MTKLGLGNLGKARNKTFFSIDLYPNLFGGAVLAGKSITDHAKQVDTLSRLNSDFPRINSCQEETFTASYHHSHQKGNQGQHFGCKSSEIYQEIRPTALTLPSRASERRPAASDIPCVALCRGGKDPRAPDVRQ